jgi:non-specific serine/threonine protein kinase
MEWMGEHALPRFATTLVGRDQETHDLTELIVPRRFIVLTGPGGVGKSRLVAEVADGLGGRFTGGVLVVDLEGTATPTAVQRHIAVALGVREAGTLSNLDNDSLVMLQDLLSQNDALGLLVISRTHLYVAGAHVYTLKPLSTPGDDGAARLDLSALAMHGSVALFVERARLVRPGFELTDTTAERVQSLCESLDGLPLAIELAASWLRVLSLDDLHDRAHSNPQFLRASTQTFDARYRTLDAVVTSTFNLCSPAEKLLWSRLSVFAGTFDLAAVEAVCGAPPLDTPELLEAFLQLVDRSVVTVDVSGSSSRYRMLRIARTVGPPDQADQEATAEQHRSYYADLVARASDDWLGPDQLSTALRLRVDYSNILRALEEGLTHPTAARATTRMVVGLWATWFVSGRFRHGQALVRRVLELPDGDIPPKERALAALVGAYLAILQGDLPAVVKFRGIARELLALEPDALANAFSRHVDGMAEMGGSDLTAAETCLTEAVTQYALIDAPMARAFAVDAMGLATAAAAMQGDASRARELGEAGLARCRAHKDVVWTAYIFFALGVEAITSGDPARARGRAVEAMTSTHDELIVTHAIELLGWCEAREGRYEPASRIMGAAARRWEFLGGPFSGFAEMSRLHAECVEAARHALGEEAYVAAVAAGSGMSARDVVTLVGRGTAKIEDDAQETPPLTRREAEVAQLLADGLSNREIAERFHLSIRTVESHVDHILTKLQLPNRTRVAAWFLARRTGRHN